MLRKPRPPKADRTAEFASHEPPKPAALWRHDGKARATVAVPVPKDEPVRHEGYRRLVAALPCILCGVEGRSQCAHGPALGKGIKCDDRLTMPLCAAAPGHPGCHTGFDQYKELDRQSRRAWMESAAAKTRARIRAAGTWPASLPVWPGDAPGAPGSPPGQEADKSSGASE